MAANNSSRPPRSEWWEEKKKLGFVPLRLFLLSMTNSGYMHCANFVANLRLLSHLPAIFLFSL